MQIINNITMLSIGAYRRKLIREREHGTLEHLLVMPVTLFEIMSAKVLAMAAVVLVASAFALNVVVRGLMGRTIEGPATVLHRRGPAPVRHHVAGYFFGDAGAFDAAIRHAAADGASASADALRRQHTLAKTCQNWCSS